MHDRDGGLVIGATQIIVECTQLLDQKHTLINDRTGRKRANISIIGTLLIFAANYVQTAVEIQAARHMLRASQEALIDRRHRVQSHLAQDLRMRRNLTPAQELKAFLRRDHLQHPHRESALHLIGRQKDHTDAVVSGTAYRDPLLCRCF